ncbi:hypothetical protein ACFL56_02690, partial [Candidatus Margulisiibacteriota bacterium]
KYNSLKLVDFDIVQNEFDDTESGLFSYDLDNFEEFVRLMLPKISHEMFIDLYERKKAIFF